MAREIPGIHHVTALAGDPQRNLDFYCGVLGLRFVKRTINFDDPATYHFYYGVEVGHPGTIITFFPWPGAPRGRHGSGQASHTAFSIPADSVGFWRERLERHGVAATGPAPRFDDRVVGFEDPDGLLLELVASAAGDGRPAGSVAGVPAAHAIRGFQSVTLAVAGRERTAGLLTGTLGFRAGPSEGDRHRFECGAGGPGAIVDVLDRPDAARGRFGVGTVHHVAWRARDEEEHEAWRRHIAARGHDVTPIVDRQYFRSIYFHEPGGVLFEIATDPPGFTRDEPPEELGTHLKLPPWLEPMRARLERTLPPVRVPGSPPGRTAGQDRAGQDRAGQDR